MRACDVIESLSMMKICSHLGDASFTDQNKLTSANDKSTPSPTMNETTLLSNAHRSSPLSNSEKTDNENRSHEEPSENDDVEDEEEKNNSVDDLADDEDMRVTTKLIDFSSFFSFDFFFFLLFSVITLNEMNFVEFRSQLNDTIRKMMILITNNR